MFGHAAAPAAGGEAGAMMEAGRDRSAPEIDREDRIGPAEREPDAAWPNLEIEQDDDLDLDELDDVELDRDDTGAQDESGLADDPPDEHEPDDPDDELDHLHDDPDRPDHPHHSPDDLNGPDATIASSGDVPHELTGSVWPARETAGEEPAGAASAAGLPVVLDFDLDRIHVPIAEVESWQPGSVVAFDVPLREGGVEVTIRANGTVVGKGDLVRIDERLAVRITRLFL